MADRLISADALTRHIENQYRKWGEEYDALQILGDIEDAPTIAAEPTKRGRWIKRGENLYECSECGAWVTPSEYIPLELHKFCRGCGAKMDGGENDI